MLDNSIINKRCSLMNINQEQLYHSLLWKLIFIA